MLIRPAANDGLDSVSRIRLGALLVAAIAIAVAVGGLARLGLVGPTVTPGPTATPDAAAEGVGLFHMTMDPAYDQLPLRLQYLVARGRQVVEYAFSADIAVIVNRSFIAGPLSIVYNDLRCDGSVMVVKDMEVDAVLEIGGDACSLVETGTHMPGAMQHPELPTTAVVGAVLPIGVPSTLVVRQLDSIDTTPVASVDVEVPPWEVVGIKVEPGRYEVSVLVDSIVLASEELDLERGEDVVVNLRVLPGDVPRACGDIDARDCEAAIAEAYADGLFTQPGEVVVSVSVRPSTYMSCSYPPNVTPAFDVTFVLGNPAGDIEVTVGRTDGGKLIACSY